MSKNDFKRFVEKKLQVKFAADYPAVLLKFPNATIDNPEEQIHAEVSFPSEVGFRKSLGQKPVNAYAGLVQIDVLIPDGTGTGVSDRMLEDVASVMAEDTFSISPNHEVEFAIASVMDIGQTGQYFRSAVRIPYTRTVYPF